MHIEQRSITVYMAVFLYVIAAILDTLCGVNYGWPKYFYFIVWLQVAGVVYATFDKRVSMKIQSFLYCTFMFVTTLMSGLYFENYVTVILMFVGTMVLASFYHSRILIVYQLCLSIIGIILHGTIFSMIDFFDSKRLLELLFAFFMLLGIGGSLYFIIFRDGQIREKLKETARRAESAERSKSDFLANMSHEIRTPMNAIIGMCELALRESGVPQGARDCCVQIQSSGRSLLSIINDILDFSKIESGKMELLEDEFCLASILNDVVNMTMTRMNDKNLEFVVQVDPSIPSGLIGDELRIRQIMINLLTNAVKYTQHGVVSLHVSQTIRSYGINLNVTVKDTGIGIKKENLDKLFNSFQQVDTKKNRAEEGSGLGLVITKRLLELMGGFITVESEYKKGSEFHFVIPLKVSNPASFVQIEDSENIVVACYIDVLKYEDPNLKKAYRQFLMNVSESIPVKKFMCKKFDEFKERVDRGMITHCFVGKEEYLEHKSYLESIAQKITVIIVQNRRDGVVVPSNMRCIYKPIYEVPIAAVLNQQTILQEIPENENSSVTFQAPKARVLIVDDNPVNLQVAAGLMQPYKMQIFTVESGRDALGILKSRDFDIVFLDHMMPELDGVETAKILRSKGDPYYQKLPIVALTANAVSGAREMFLANGFDGFLAKPMELSALDRVLKQHLPPEYILKLNDSKPVDAELDAMQVESEQEVLVSQEAALLIDAKTGLFYVGNNVATYLSILKTYVDKGENKQKLLDRLFKEENWKNYTIEVHALKSSSLSIGAKELSEKAKNLEMSGKAGDISYIKNHHEAMMEEYHIVLGFGEQILKDNIRQKTPDFEGENAANKKILDKAQLVEVLQKLEEAYKAFDSDEMVNLATEGLAYECEGVMLTQIFSKIKKAADDFEYDEVNKQIQELRANFGLEKSDA